MTPLDCDACRLCLGCSVTFCRDNEVSPGEGDGICTACFETEDDGPEAA